MNQEHREYDTDRLDQFNDLSMRVGIGQIKELDDERLRFARQLGITDVLINPLDPDSEWNLTLELGQEWTYEQLVDVRDRVEAAGLRLYGLERMPFNLYCVLLDDDPTPKIEMINGTIRNMGRAGIPILGYSGHSPTGVIRTSSKTLRGRAQSTAFDPGRIPDGVVAEVRQTYRDSDRECTESGLWNAYEDFLKEVIPVAEESGITLGLHPTDPPIEEIAGVPLLFSNFENHRRAIELVPSESHGIKLGMGCWSEMGADLPEVIRHFGGENIVYAHFRDVVGTVETGFYETFIDDEESNYDEYEALQTLKEVGFTGVLTPDHVPKLPGETEWAAGGFRCRAFTVGYLEGMLEASNSKP